MELSELQKHWNAYGEIDPLWAILSEPDKRWNRWSLDEFFEIGRTQVRHHLKKIQQLGVQVSRGSALDFGCGVGRLTQALAEHFQNCQGIDIAPSMVEKARELNRHGERVQYTVNSRDDLSLFPNNSFDLVYTTIVLQHMEPKYAKAYMREFVRILKPQGIGIFQLPGGQRSLEEARQQFTNDILDHALPQEGYRVFLQPDNFETRVIAGKHFPLNVRIRNISPVRWPRFGLPDTQFAIRLGARWFTEQGHARDDIFQERHFMNVSLNPGQETSQTLSINIPPEPGYYYLEIDMAQEWVGWFKDKGGQCCRYGVEVVPESSAPAAPVAASTATQPAAVSAEKFEPCIEMYHIPKEEVVQILTEAGAKVLHVEDLQLSSNYLDFEYYFTK